MDFLRQILRLCVIMLFSALGANMAFAVPTTTSDITYFQTETIHVTQGDDVGFAARAPPMAETNVEVTGGVTSMQGSAFALHGQETVAALFGFDGDLNAPNRVPNIVIDTKIQTQMSNRGWSRQNVDDVIADGPAGRTTDNRRPNKTDDGLGRDDTATVYGSSGNYVVVNDRTGEIVQVSGRNDPSWIDDGRIQWD